MTYAAAVPTVWLGLLEHLRQTGGRLDGLERICVGGAACPQLLLETFGDEYGVRVNQGWGMTEMSPVGAYNSRKPGRRAERRPPPDRLKQGPPSSASTLGILDAMGARVPWDGGDPGELVAKGPWVCRGYYREDARRRRRGLVPHRRHRHDRPGRLHPDHRPPPARSPVSR